MTPQPPFLAFPVGTPFKRTKRSRYGTVYNLNLPYVSSQGMLGIPSTSSPTTVIPHSIITTSGIGTYFCLLVGLIYIELYVLLQAPYTLRYVMHLSPSISNAVAIHHVCSVQSLFLYTLPPSPPSNLYKVAVPASQRPNKIPIFSL